MTQTISVVIPVFNRTWQLRRALKALVCQTYKEFEVIVCDDGSTEDIAKVILDFKRDLKIKFIRINNSGGPAMPRNIGVRLANADWIAFLDSDDWWDSSRLAAVVSNLNDSVDLLYHPLRVVREMPVWSLRGRRFRIGSPITGEPLRQMALFGNPLPTSAVVVRKTLLVAVGMMPEDSALVAIEDFDCWLSLAKVGARISYLDKCLGNYWVGGDAISAISAKHIDGQKLIFERHRQSFDKSFIKFADARQSYVLALMYFYLGGHHKEVLSYLGKATPMPSLTMSIKCSVILLWTRIQVLIAIIQPKKT